jgi:hypothetical protein
MTAAQEPLLSLAFILDRHDVPLEDETAPVSVHYIFDCD